MTSQFRWAIGTLTAAALTADDTSLPINWMQFPPYRWRFYLPEPLDRFADLVSTFAVGEKPVGGITFPGGMQQLVMLPAQYAYLRSHRFPTDGVNEAATLRVLDVKAGDVWITVSCKLILEQRPARAGGKFIHVTVRAVNGVIAPAGE